MRSIFPLCFFAAVPALGAGNIVVEVPWNCPQTYATKVPSGPAKLRVEFNPETGATQSPEFERILKDAGEYPTLDFFDCAAAFTRWVYGYSWQKCEMDKIKTGVCASRREFNTKFDTLERLATKYGAAAAAHNPVTPFEPGARAVGPIGKERESIRKVRLTGKCALGDLPEANDFLDGAFIEGELPGLLKANSDGGICAKAITVDYARLLLASEMTPAQCKAQPSRCKDRRAAVDATVAKLVKAGVSGLAPVLAAGGADPCCVDGGTKVPERLSDLAQTAKMAGSCARMKPGDPPRAVTEDGGTGLSPEYSLEHAGERDLAEDYVRPDGTVVAMGARVPVLRATVDLRFSESQDEYTRTTRDCYKEAAPALRGPDGEFLEITLREDNPGLADRCKACASIKTEVKIREAGYRSSRREWQKDISCSTILHETMHTLGLCDGYREMAMGAVVGEDGKVNFVEKDAKLAKYDCRVVAPKDSIMNNESGAYREALVETYQIKMCTCGLTGTARNCEKLVKKMKPGATACPKGTALIDPTWDKASVDREKLAPGTFFGADKTTYILDVTKKPRARHSLFYPAEWRAITKPGCSAENKLYYSCSRDAYKTSRERYGSARCGLGLPSECRSEDAIWLR